jgi:hypothetical protein
MFSFSTLRLDLIGGAAMPFLCASPRLACAWLPHRMETR